MAYSDYSPPRRSRRRRNVIILVILAMIVGVVALAVRYRTERRESIDYLTIAEDIATQHADMANQLGELFQGLGGERPDLELRLETLATQARDAANLLDEQVVARPVAEVAGLMSVAADSWADGMEVTGDAIIAILDAEANDLSADEKLREAFELIRLGDRAYERVLVEVAGLEPELVPSPLPEVAYTQGLFEPLYDHTVVAARLRLQGGLAELISVSLVANTVPEPVSEDPSGIRTIPASESLALEVTVSNTGNVVVENVSVTVNLQRVASGEILSPLAQLIPSIEPGNSEKATFENIDAIPGEVYSITAVAAVEGQDDVGDDNSFTLVFERNAE